MRKFIPVFAALIAVGSLAQAPAFAEGDTRNAIVSEGNGAAVFIGYGGNRQVELQWRPSKQYDAATILYQVQRSDGAMLESKKQSTNYIDKNLQPNTEYTYALTVFQLVEKTSIVKGQKITKTLTKVVGKNKITVLTLPSMVVNMRAPLQDTSLRTDASVTNYCSFDVVAEWEAPINATNSPITYSVYLNGNLIAYGITATSYRFTGLMSNTGHDVKVVAENKTGPATDNAHLGARMNAKYTAPSSCSRLP